jgi:hypothetical protein
MTVAELNRRRSRRWALLQVRHRAHETFDVLWKNNYMTRSDAYRWLCSQTGMTRADCHFGRFDIGVCEAIRDLSKRKLKALKLARKRRRV